MTTDVPTPAGEPSPRYWVLVGSPDNVARTAALGFSLQGIKSRHRKKAERMAPGDGIAYYVTGYKAFAGTARVTSACFEDHTPIWQSLNLKRADEDYPYRVRIEPDVIAAAEDWVAAEPIARQMTYARKWPPEHWTLAFQGNLHEVDAGDFGLIRDALERAMSANPATDRGMTPS